MLLPVQGYLDVNLRKNSEYVCLQHGHEDLEPEQHYRHRHRYCGHQGRPRVQDKAEEDENEQMPGQDVGVEPHGERERLGELRHPLDKEHERDHDRFGRHPRRHERLNVSPSPLRLMPTTWVMTNVSRARTRVKEMLLVTGKLLGTRPSRFKTNKNTNRLRV